MYLNHFVPNGPRRYAAPLMELASSPLAVGWAAALGALHFIFAALCTWNWLHVEYFRGESGYAHFITSGGNGTYAAAAVRELGFGGNINASCEKATAGTAGTMF